MKMRFSTPYRRFVMVSLAVALAVSLSSLAACAPKTEAPRPPAPAAVAPKTEAPKPTTPAVAAPKTEAPKPTTGATSKPTATVTPKPTLTPVLSAARDLTGTWKGTGVYHQLDTVSGARARKITADVTLRIVQKGDAVTGDISDRVAKTEPGGPVAGKGTWLASYEGWAPYGGGLSSWETPTIIVGQPIPKGLKERRKWRAALEDLKVGLNLVGHSFGGTASVTNLYLQGQRQNPPAEWKWEFSFTTDLMSGGFKQFARDLKPRYEGNKYENIYESDPKGFNLVRQKE